MGKQSHYRTPDLTQKAFARTNLETIGHRLSILQDRMPDILSIGEICCGDCLAQYQAYQKLPKLETYRGLDLVPEIVAYNKKRGIDCVCGSALENQVMKQFLDCDVLFYGPPLSEDCDGHSLLPFRKVTPDYLSFARLMFGELAYDGTIVAICPNSTTMGDIQLLNSKVQSIRPGIALSLIHHSHASVSGTGAHTGLRLKYIELWFSTRHPENWEILDTGLEKS